MRMMLWPESTAVFIRAGVHPRGQGLQGPDQHVVDAIRGRPACRVVVLQHREQDARIQRRPVHRNRSPGHDQNFAMAMTPRLIPVHAQRAKVMHGVGPSRIGMLSGPDRLDSCEPFLPNRRIGRSRTSPKGAEVVRAAQHVFPQVWERSQSRKCLMRQMCIVRPRPHTLLFYFSAL